MSKPPLPDPGKFGVSVAPASAPGTPSHASPSSVTGLLSSPGAGVHSFYGLHRPQLATTPAEASPSAHGQH